MLTLIRLRCLGIPCRIATGYLVKQWDEDEQYYWVTRANQHAWLEVCFEGIGWVSFDPTPSMPDAEQAQSLADTDALLASEESEDEAFASEIPWPIWQVIALAIGLAVLAAAPRFLASNASMPASGDFAPTSGPLRALIDSLASSGYRIRPGQTPWELAQEISAESDPVAAECTPWIRKLYAHRYGPAVWDDAEHRAFALYLHRLAKKEKENRASCRMADATGLHSSHDRLDAESDILRRSLTIPLKVERSPNVYTH